MSIPYAQHVDSNQGVLVWDASYGYTNTINEQNYYESLNYGLNQAYPSIEACNAARQTNWFVLDTENANGEHEVWQNVAGTAADYATTTITDAQIAGALILETSTAVEGFTITLSVPSLYAFNAATGYAPSHQVAVGIYYKKLSDTSSTWNCLHPNYVISSTASRSEILKTVTTHPTKLDFSRYKILVIRLTESHVGSFDFADEIYVKELTEIVYETLSYPHTAMLGIKIRATDQLSGSPPTVTSLVKGIKVSVPTNLISGGAYNRNGYSSPMGAMSTTKVWTDNTIWCLYDLLTNKRYGMADYYKINPDKLGLMQANFYLMAKYCDELLESTNLEDPPGIPVGKTVPVAHVRPRFTLNIVLDQSKAASEWVAAIAATMRASVFYSEGVFWVDIDRPKLMSQIFNMSNIREYSQSGTSYRNIPNTYEVQWINPKATYEVDVFRMESEEFRFNQALEERKKALLLLGITSFDHAKSIGAYALYAGMYRTKLITFKTSTSGLRSMVGDVIGVQHDVPKWGWGGVVDGFTNTQIGYASLNISAPFDYPAGSGDLQVTIMSGHHKPIVLDAVSPTPNSTGNTQIEVQLAYTDEDLTQHTYTPKKGDRYVLCMATNAINKFKISAVKRDSDEFVEIMAVEYDEQIYNKCDDIAALGTWVSTDHSLLPSPTRSSVSGVTAHSKIYSDSAGTFKVGVEVFFDAPQTTFWRSAEIFYSLAGSGVYTNAGSNSSGYFMIPDIAEAGTYQIIVCSVYSTGKQTVDDALNDVVRSPFTVIDVTPYTPNESFLLGVRGLSIVNKGNDETFTGKDCRVSWFKPLSVDAAVNSTTTGNAGTSTVDNWFKNYVVEIRNVSYASDDIDKNNPIPGSIKRTTVVYDESFIYTHEMNHEDLGGVSRTFSVTVVAYDRLGRASAPKTIICSNPAPAAIA